MQDAYSEIIVAMVKISTFEVTYFIFSEKNEKILFVKEVQNEIDNNLWWEKKRVRMRKLILDWQKKW